MCGEGRLGSLRCLGAGAGGRFRAGLHQGGEAEAAGAEAEFGETEFLNHRVVNGHAHEDYVGAVFRKAEDGFTLFERQTPEPFEVPGDARRTQAGCLDTGAVECLEAGLHAPQDGGGAAYPDQLCASSWPCGSRRRRGGA